MSDSFEYREYRPGDEGGIVALLKKAFTKWRKRSVDFWRWKYLESPHGVHIWVATDADKIIGVICDVPVHLKLGDRLIDVHYSDDTATDPDYRGKGVYSKLFKYYKADQVKRGVYFTYWATENPIISKEHILLPFSLCRMIKIKDVKKYLANIDKDTLKNWLGFALLKGSNSLVNLTGVERDAERNYSISGIEGFDERIDAFWDKVKGDYNFILEKNHQYLNWRYLDNKFDQHSIRYATRDGEVLGFSVLRLGEYEDNSEGSIVDLLALTGRPDVAEGLIEDALSWFEPHGVNSVYCQTIRGHPYQRLLAKRGFIDVTRASKNLVYCTPEVELGLHAETFSAYSPKSIYFNFY